MYGVANVSVIPLRAEPSERAEMVSQLLFGEAYSVVETNDQWVKIKTCDCDYEGWMAKKCHHLLPEASVSDYLSSQKYVVKDFLLMVRATDSPYPFPIFAGSSFPKPVNGIVSLGDLSFQVELPEEQDIPDIKGMSPQQFALMQCAMVYYNAPYLWGGRSPAGIDCSGFVQVVFKNIGIFLPRDASQQVNIGSNVDFITEAQIGDLAFFQNDAGYVCHVGIVCGHQQIIHASGKVRIDTLDSTGIFCHETQQYTHFLRVIKRLIP